MNIVEKPYVANLVERLKKYSSDEILEQEINEMRRARNAGYLISQYGSRMHDVVDFMIGIVDGKSPRPAGLKDEDMYKCARAYQAVLEDNATPVMAKKSMDGRLNKIIVGPHQRFLNFRKDIGEANYSLMSDNDPLAIVPIVYRRPTATSLFRANTMNVGKRFVGVVEVDKEPGSGINKDYRLQMDYRALKDIFGDFDFDNVKIESDKTVFFKLSARRVPRQEC